MARLSGSKFNNNDTGHVKSRACARYFSGDSQNRELEPQPPILPEATREAAPVEIKPLAPKPGQLSFTVKRFVFVGNSKLSNDDLQPIVADFIDKPITFDDLKRITDAVTEYYRERGWLVRVILPQQDITEGTVTIRIIEARLGGLKIKILTPCSLPHSKTNFSASNLLFP